MMRSTIFLLVLFGLLTACGGRQHKEQSHTGDAIDLPGREWRLVELQGKPIPFTGDTAPNMAFLKQEGRVAGHSGCNRFGGGYKTGTTTGIFTSLTFTPLMTTRMACVDQARNALEQAFTATLEKVDAYSLQSGGLVLYRDKEPLLRFESVRP
jgi:heat shock protein HslJ